MATTWASGRMKVDLRDVDLPPGRTDLPLELGMGEIQVLVPDDVCVTTDAEVGVGAVNAGDGDQGGVDLDVDDSRAVAPGVAQLHVIADVGIGAVHDRRPASSDSDGPVAHGATASFERCASRASRAACEGAA